MVEPIVPARLGLTPEGIPFSETFRDVYHSADGGLQQAQHVFLAGNGLPGRWRGRNRFTILETGFGFGLNFLATWTAFRDDPERPRTLHFVSVEKHPFSRQDLAELHRRWPQFATLSAELIGAWPPLIAGFHRMHLDGGRVALTLLFGDAVDLLPQLNAHADALYLDGFAPAKNPDLWSAEIAAELARLAAPGCTFATYTVAASVRHALAHAGFSMAKRPGFGRKRDMLTGSHPGLDVEAAPATDRRAIVIGAGLAGTACAERLAARGWNVQLLDRHGTTAEEASGNPSGVLRPILNRANTANARLSHTAFLYAVRHLDLLARNADTPAWSGTGVLQLGPQPRDADRLGAIIAEQHLPDDFVCAVSADEARELAGTPTSAGGAWFQHGAWVNMPFLCRSNLARHAERIDGRFAQTVQRIEAAGEGWCVLDTEGKTIASASIVILANATQCNQVGAGLPVRAVRGQLTYLPPSPRRRLRVAVSGNGYIAAMPNGGWCCGATFQRGDEDPTVRATDHEENLARVESLLPGFTAGLDARRLNGRVGWRTSTPDRLPIFGELAPGLWCATGLGTRGLLWAALGAELIAAQVEREPWPVERDLAAAVRPSRFTRQRTTD
jgi:tRNA 5-methylaminomethyl-2-thiouridine biosynthesis bifunctional protein